MQKRDIEKAVNILRSGGLVAIPTETVYGLGADARNISAVQKIFIAKQRPSDHPLIVHLADISQLAEWAIDVSSEAMLLAKAFWPGPLTLILKKAAHAHDLVTGGQQTIGLRIPDHPVALAVLKEYGGGIAAPSANRFGRISPTTAAAVRDELGDAVDLILEGGQCNVGVESTIVDVSGEKPAILRPGVITAKHIETVLGYPVLTHKENAPRVSGSLESHYAPQTKTRLMSTAELNAFLKNKESKVAIVIWSDLDVHDNLSVVMSTDPYHYAHDLYQVMRDLDKQGLNQIIFEKVPETVEWDAVRDRLQRASHA